MWRRTLDGWGYSPLDQIDRDNMGDLRLVWTPALGAGRQQGTPLVRDGVLFMPNPSDVIQAIDAVTGDLIWEHRRDRPDDLADYMIGTLTETNRNIAIHGKLIIDASMDDHVFALNAETGELVWHTEILDYRVNPANQDVGADHGRREGVLGPELRLARRPPRLRHHGARRGDRRGAVADAPHPRPRRAGRRDLGRRAVQGTHARRLVDGAELRPGAEPSLRRHVRHVAGPEVHARGNRPDAPLPQLDPGPGRGHVRDRLVLPAHERPLGPRPPVRGLLVDTAVRPDPSAVSWINPRLSPGEERRVVTGIPGKTGIVYTLNRETGEFLWATPTIVQNVVSGIDGATGAVTENAELIFTVAGQTVVSCPPASGGKDWEAGAYSPRTNTVYMPVRNTCARLLATRDAGIH